MPQPARRLLTTVTLHYANGSALENQIDSPMFMTFIYDIL